MGVRGGKYQIFLMGQACARGLTYIPYFDLHHNLLKICIVFHIMSVRDFIFIESKGFLNLKILQSNYSND